MKPTQPLLSFIVFCYNQEHFIEKALESALSQTYSPLEIIVSDDCSKDGTWDRIQELAKTYKGPHTLIITRTPRNSGIAENINHAFSMASGELWVVQSGDDISHPTRTEELWQAWESHGRPDLVWSAFKTIHEDGTPKISPAFSKKTFPTTELKKAVDKGYCVASGCSCAYTPKLFRKYGPLSPDVFCEDVLFPFRAMLGDGILVLNKPLLDYRIHDNNMSTQRLSGAFDIHKYRRILRNQIAIYADWLHALALSPKNTPSFTKKVSGLLQAKQVELTCFSSSKMQAALKAFRLLPLPGGVKTFVRVFRFYIGRKNVHK